MDAAAMDALFPSPFTTVSLGVVMPLERLPSISARSGETDRPSMARCMASIRAFKILRASISSASAQAMDQATASSRMRSYKTSRRFSVTFLESPSHGWVQPLGKITAPA